MAALISARGGGGGSGGGGTGGDVIINIDGDSAPLIAALSGAESAVTSWASAVTAVIAGIGISGALSDALGAIESFTVGVLNFNAQIQTSTAGMAVILSDTFQDAYNGADVFSAQLEKASSKGSSAVSSSYQHMADATQDHLEKISDIQADILAVNGDNIIARQGQLQQALEDAAEAHESRMGALARQLASINEQFEEQSRERDEAYQLAKVERDQDHAKKLVEIAKKASAEILSYEKDLSEKRADSAQKLADLLVHIEEKRFARIDKLARLQADYAEKLSDMTTNEAENLADYEDKRASLLETAEERTIGLRQRRATYERALAVAETATQRALAQQQLDTIDAEIAAATEAVEDRLALLEKQRVRELAHEAEKRDDEAKAYARKQADYEKAVAKEEADYQKQVAKEGARLIAAEAKLLESHTKKLTQIEEQRTKENEAFAEASQKATDRYEQEAQKAEKAHARAVAALQARMADEDAAYGKQVAKLKKQAEQDMIDLKAQNEEKVKELEKRLAREDELYNRRMRDLQQSAAKGGGGGDTKEMEILKFRQGAADWNQIGDLNAKIEAGDYIPNVQEQIANQNKALGDAANDILVASQQQAMSNAKVVTKWVMDNATMLSGNIGENLKAAETLAVRKMDPTLWMGRVSSAAKLMGRSPDQLANALGYLTAGNSGVAMRAFRQIQIPMDDIISDVTTTFDEKMQKVYDRLGRFGDMLPIMQNTWEFTFANMQDIWTLFVGEVGKPVFEMLNEGLVNLYNYINTNKESLQETAKIWGTNIANALNGVWETVVKLWPVLEKLWVVFQEQIWPVLKVIGDFIGANFIPIMATLTALFIGFQIVIGAALIAVLAPFAAVLVPIIAGVVGFSIGVGLATAALMAWAGPVGDFLGNAGAALGQWFQDQITNAYYIGRAIRDTMDRIGEFFGMILGHIGRFIQYAPSTIMNAFGRAGSAIGDWFGRAGRQAEAELKIWGDNIGALPGMVLNFLGDVLIGIEAWWEDFNVQMNASFERASSSWGASWDALWAPVALLITTVWNGLSWLWVQIDAIMTGINATMVDAWNWIKSFMERTTAQMIGNIQGDWNNFMAFLDNAWVYIQTAIGVAWEAIRLFFETWWNNLVLFIQGIIGIDDATGVRGFLASSWKWIEETIGFALAGWKLLFEVAWNWISKTIMDIVGRDENSGLRGSLGRAWESVKSAISSILGADDNSGLRGIFKTTWAAIETGIKNWVNVLISGVNRVLGALRNLAQGIKDTMNFVVPGSGDALPDFGGMLPDIAPWLAGGGTVYQAGLAWVGEKGAELVNLPKGAEVYSHSESMNIANNDNKGDTYNFYGNTKQKTPMEIKNAIRLTQLLKAGR
jgi:hypothetical protein